MIKNLFKITLRNFKKQLGFSLLNILGLTIGMASFILISLWIMDEFDFDRKHVNSERIFMIHKSYHISGNLNYNTSTPAPLAPRIKIDFPEVVASTRVSERRVLVKYRDKVFYDKVAFADPDFLKMFTLQFVKGDVNNALANFNSIVISKRIADKYFGDKNAIGKVLLLNGRTNFTVSGVFENPPENTSVGFEIIGKLDDERFRNNWDDHPYETYMMLTEGSNISEVDQKITEIMHEEITYEKIGIRSMRFSDYHLRTINGENEKIQYVNLFIAIAIFVLFIAIINFMNLSTARASRRSKEIGLRKVMGAGRKQLIMQFLLESIVFAFISLVLAMVVAELLKPLFNQLTNKNLMLNYTDPILLFELLAIILFTGILAGAYPAFVLSSFRPIVALKGTFNIGVKGLLFRKILVILQFSISIALIISTIIIYSQLNFIQQKDIGFDKENVIHFRVAGNIVDRFDAFKGELLQNSNIVNVSRTSQLPSQMYDIKRGVVWEGAENSKGSIFGQCAVDFDYFETMKMEIVLGRGHSKEFGTDHENIVLNQKAVDLIGWENPIGKYFVKDSRRTAKVIGVVKDFNYLPATDAIGPMFFFHNPNWFGNVIIRINENNTKEAISYIENVFDKYAPGLPFHPNFLDQLIDQKYQSEQKIGLMSAIFACIAIVISCLGLFGLAAHTAEQKTKEIGIRKVFGASITNVILKLSISFTIWVIIANLIAWPVAYLVMSDWLKNFAYRIELQWWVFLFSGVLALIVALLTVIIQAAKAGMKNPIELFRYE